MVLERRNSCISPAGRRQEENATSLDFCLCVWGCRLRGTASLLEKKERERETGNRSSNPLGLYHSSALRQHSVCPQPAGEKAEPGKAEASAPVSQARRVGVCRVTRLRKPGVANAALPLVHSLT